MSSLNIMLVGHGCAPERGSEPGVTWNWAWHLAAKNRVWVVTHGSFRAQIERHLRQFPRPNLRFVWVGPCGRWDPWDGVRSRWIRLHYFFWRHAAAKAAKRLIAAEPIDVVHHVGWNTISAPPLLWQTGKPFVWGPVGGGHTVPWRFFGCLGSDAVAEALRTLRVAVLPWTPTLRRTIAKANLILAANRETAAALRRAGACTVGLLPDIGIPAALLRPARAKPPGTGLTVLWAGRFEFFKGLKICLDVAKAVQAANVSFQIVGDGRRRAWMERRVRKFGRLRQIALIGRMPWTALQQRFAEADVFLFTSLRDTFGAVVFEAMAKGCPVICLDHQGAGSHLPDDAAIKIPLTTRRRVAQEMARQIDLLAADRARLRRISEAAYRFAAEQQWSQRAILIEAWYRDVLAGNPASAQASRRSSADLAEVAAAHVERSPAVTVE